MGGNFDEATLHQIEEELDTKIYPGTEIMADVGSHHFVKGGSQVLVPQPSADPNDPLNWSKGWKASAMSISTAVTFAQGFGPLALAPMFPQLIEAFDSNLTDVVQFTGVCILVLGFSNFIWVPIQTSFGRRPVLLFSTLICLASNIWRAKAQTYSSFMGACVLNGIGAGPAETAQPTIIADIMFLHERGAYNTLYFACYFGSLTIGPLTSGLMASRSNWRNFWWLNVAVHGMNFIAIIFAFPETKWHRVHHKEMVAHHLTTQHQPSDEKVNSEVVEKVDRDSEKGAPVTTDMLDLSVQATVEQDPYLGKGTPSKAQFKVFQTNPHPFKSILTDLWIPWKLFAFPIVEFSSFCVSWTASSFLNINLTQSQNFAAPPYNFSSMKIGLFNIAVLVGAIIGLFTCGPLSDWFSMRLTRRNRGIREPEMRLPTMIPYVIIMLIGNFVVAYGYENKWRWQTIVMVGFTCAGIQVAALPAITSTYSVDSYKPVAGSVFVSITVNKNVWGYGFSKFITPWIEKDGFVPPIMLNMSLILLFCLFAIPFYFYGKTFRKWTRNSSVHSM